jgi:hypothetical protein
VLGDVAFTHGGYVICSVSLWAFRRVWRCVADGL